MFHCGQPWSVSIPAQYAGIAALQCNDYWAHSLSLIHTERAFLIRELKKRNMNVIPSKANYILFYSPTQVTGTLMSAPSEVTAVTLEGSVGMTPGFVARKTSFREATSTEE